MTTSAPAAAAPRRISGELSKPGYTVIALAADGKAKVVRASGRRFSLTPPASRVTLHLRAPNGTYAGPVVVGRDGKRAIVGVKAGARLGEVKVAGRRGYAKVSKRLPDNSIDQARTARAKNGVPIGATVFGRVRSKPPDDAPPVDRDLDGIPDPLDIDDDGDLILDNLDRSARLRAAQTASGFSLASSLALGLENTANANAGSSQEQIDATIESTLPSLGGLQAPAAPGTTAELDCAGDPAAVPPRPGLSYCSGGGTGRRGGPMFGFKRFPEDFDPDRDGFGTMTPPPGGDLLHGARSDQIKTGDVLIAHVTSGGADESACPSPSGELTSTCTSRPVTLQYVFATVPALVSYRDGAEPLNFATVSYPVAPPGAGSPGGPGTRGNGFPVAAGCKDVVVACDPAVDVFVTLTFWRPQRRPIAGEPCLSDTPPSRWVDVGGLTYFTSTGHVVSSGGPPLHRQCPQSAYSATADQPLGQPPAGLEGLTDMRSPPDQPAAASNSFTYTLNLTKCRTAIGAPWSSGDEATFSFVARASFASATDKAQQDIVFKRK